MRYPFGGGRLHYRIVWNFLFGLHSYHQGLHLLDLTYKIFTQW